MTIRIRLYRAENLAKWGCQSGEEVSLDLEAYVAGVVASEIGNAPVEACKAQAIAARTYAIRYVMQDKPVSDQSSKHQAFRASRLDAMKYPNAHQAAKATEGFVLCYDGKVIETCAYSSCNGGRTVSSKERWGGEHAYLVGQDDPWDASACALRRSKGEGIHPGHGVGMSQYGATQAANEGVSYRDILSFYYPGTTVQTVIRGEQEMIEASKLVQLFQKAADEKWGYIWGAAGETWTQAKQNSATHEMTVKYGQQWVGKRVADCSGLFVWAYKQCGESIAHGSNSIWRSHLSAKGDLKKGARVDGQALKIGAAVFQTKADPKQDDGEDQYHIGLYIGNGKVIEAMGTREGVRVTDLVKRDWEQWGELKKVNYENEAGGNNMSEVKNYMCITSENGGDVNFRVKPSTSAARVVKYPSLKVDTLVNVLSTDGEWSCIAYGGCTGYVMTKFLRAVTEGSDTDDDETVQDIVLQINALVAKLAARAT